MGIFDADIFYLTPPKAEMEDNLLSVKRIICELKSHLNDGVRIDSYHLSECFSISFDRFINAMQSWRLEQSKNLNCTVMIVHDSTIADSFITWIAESLNKRHSVWRTKTPEQHNTRKRSVKRDGSTWYNTWGFPALWYAHVLQLLYFLVRLMIFYRTYFLT